MGGSFKTSTVPKGAFFLIACFPHCTGELGILKMLNKISIFATPNNFWLLAASCGEALGSSPPTDFYPKLAFFFHYSVSIILRKHSIYSKTNQITLKQTTFMISI